MSKENFQPKKRKFDKAVVYDMTGDQPLEEVVLVNKKTLLGLGIHPTHMLKTNHEIIEYYPEK